MPPIASVGNGNEIQADAAFLDDCARDSLEHDNPANMAHPPNANSSLLEALPDELLMETFEHLVCDKTSSTDEPAYDTITLRSLCLVSKRIDLIARPYLFKKIYVERPYKLIKLYRTIIGNQQLGERIKEIDLDLDLNMIELNAAQRQALRDGRYQQTAQCGLETSAGIRDDREEIGILCYKLLSHAVNLSSLKMNISPDEDVIRNSDTGHVGRRGLSRHQLYSAFFNHVSSAIRSTAGRGAAVFLPQLKTLTLWSYEYLSVEAFELFLALPSLKTIQSIRDDGNWWHLTPRAELYEPEMHLHNQRWARRNITTLDLGASPACQYDMDDIAELFPCLEVLSVEDEFGFHRDGRLSNYVRNDSHRELSTALGRLTALQTLKIDLYPEFRFGHDLSNDLTASLGPGRVLSLAKLPVLQHLEVPLYMFSYAGRLDLGGTTAVPQKALPRSLKSLVLLAKSTCGGCVSLPKEEGCWDSVGAALAFLESVGDEVPCFPHLESVAYCFLTSSCGNPFSSTVQGSQDDEAAKDSTLSRLQAIHASFSRQKVQFLVQEGYGRRTIDLQDLEK